MRFLSGIIVGALIVIGAAYVHDASIDSTRGNASRPMVNWDVVSESVRGLSGFVQDGWNRLSEAVHRGN